MNSPGAQRWRDGFPLALELRASDTGVVRRTPRGGKSATEFSGRVLDLVLVSRETRHSVFIARGGIKDGFLAVVAVFLLLPESPPDAQEIVATDLEFGRGEKEDRPWRAWRNKPPEMSGRKRDRG
jgi:hypothetical protein